MIRKIASQWHVPEKVLVQEYLLQQGAIPERSRRGPPVTQVETDAALEAAREG